MILKSKLKMRGKGVKGRSTQGLGLVASCLLTSEINLDLEA